MKKIEDIVTDDVYNSLKQIQEEEKVKLSDKAFIAQFLAKKLIKLGYRKEEVLNGK